MSARLPLCAYCGGSMARAARITCTRTTEIARPTYGWHASTKSVCLEDPLWNEYRALLGSSDPKTPQDREAVCDLHAALLAKIEARGPGRVVRRQVRSNAPGGRS